MEKNDELKRNYTSLGWCEFVDGIRAYHRSISLIYGQPSSGKTGFVLRSAINVARKCSGTVYVVSYDMRKENMQRQIHRLRKEVDDCTTNVIPFDLQGFNITDLKDTLEELIALNPSMIVLDGIDLISDSNLRSQEDTANQVDRILFDTTRLLDAPVLVTRTEQRSTQMPRLGHKCVAMADLAIRVQNDPDDRFSGNKIVEIMKNRYGKQNERSLCMIFDKQEVEST